jgi:hypothetical protein
MTPLLSENKPKPSVTALLGGVGLFIAAGAWFFIKFITLLLLQLNGETVVGVIKTYYPSTFGASVSYVVKYTGQEQLYEANVFFSRVFQDGENVNVLADKLQRASYIKEMLIPNGVLFFCLAIALWVCGVVFAVKLEVLEKIRKKLSHT